MAEGRIENAERSCAQTQPYSVLLTVYANENPLYFQQSLVSMETQTVPPSEMVLVVDGPIPDTLEDLIAHFADHAPFDVRVIRLEKRSGLGIAARTGMLACRNELVARMDSDDIATYDRMEKTLDAFAAQPELGIVGTQAVEFHGTLDNITSIVELPQAHEDIVAFSKRRCPVRHPSLTLRKSEVLAAGNYDGNYPYFEDWDLINRMLAHGCRALNLSDICLFIRADEGFYRRRGGRTYLPYVVKFKLAQFERGYFNAADLACSLTPHVIVCLMPNSARALVYETLLRKPVPRPSNQKNALFYTESWGIGGVETSIIDIVHTLADEPIDFMLFSVWKFDNSYDERRQELGLDAVFLFDEKKTLVRRCLSGWQAFNVLLGQKPFDIVHINTSNGAGFVYARIAKLRNVPTIIVHSHSSRFGQGHALSKTFFHHVGRIVGASAVTERLACSQEAGYHLYGDRDFKVIRRGVDMRAFCYDPEARKRVREQLGIGGGAFVVGNIGRISPVKNPLFQVQLFAEFHKRVSDSVLLLVGDGELREQRNAEIERLGISECVFSVDATSTPQLYYSAMDCFIMPSLYEGLPTTAIEAQVAGLPIIMSDSITREACITDLVHRCSLEAGVLGWANELVDLYEKGAPSNRAIYQKEVEQAGFSHDAMRAALLEVYGA